MTAANRGGHWHCGCASAYGLIRQVESMKPDETG